MTLTAVRFIINAIAIVIVFYSIVLHEISHGLVAYWLGDDTAKRMRRLSFNPLRHIDMVGTVILPLLLYFTVGFVFGYAKPVPINPYNFRNVKRDVGLTSLAGPICNILIAITFAVIYHLVPGTIVMREISYLVVLMNLLLALFNLIPFPPLDGSKVIGMLMPWNMYTQWMSLQQIGMYILLGFVLISQMMRVSVISQIILPPLTLIMKLLGLH